MALTPENINEESVISSPYETWKANRLSNFIIDLSRKQRYQQQEAFVHGHEWNNDIEKEQSLLSGLAEITAAERLKNTLNQDAQPPKLNLPKTEKRSLFSTKEGLLGFVRSSLFSHAEKTKSPQKPDLNQTNKNTTKLRK